MPGKRRKTYLILTALILFSVLGGIISQSVFADFQDRTKQEIRKFLNVIQLVKIYYVENVPWDKAIEGAIAGLLEKLDPHSVYISPSRVKENRESFSGHYEGIGIQFDVINGYLTVIAPIAGSPSDRLGIQSGDRIVRIDGKSCIGISREEVPKRLKGPKGTTVRVTIIREGLDEPLEFTIVRDVIPISAVTTYFMADDSTGYISVNRFSATTSKEVEETLLELEKQNISRLILDLRQNPGGYLREAVKLAGKFIPGHQLIVSTRGRSGAVEEAYYSDQFPGGKVRDYPLIILIDNGSASASEIVAGAVQDYDRGLIVGTNSFGKGLVQKEFSLRDGSAVRITTAKYYTPSGRCIQRDYKGKRLEEYYAESHDTSLTSADSQKERPIYYTRSGRTVYGDGGIHPDVEVKYKSGPKSPRLINKILQKRLFFEFTNELVHRHPGLRTSLKRFQKEYNVDRATFMEFKKYCREHEINFKEEDFQKDRAYISMRLKAEIARKFWENDGFYYVLINEDNQFKKALTLFDEAKKLASINN